MMRVTPSAHPLARGRAVVRRATSGEDGAVVETPSPEESAEEKAAAELAAVLESIATEREALIETEMEQKQREMKALESQEDLELVATKQAQLAATAWEENAEAEEAVARRMARSDAAFEAMYDEQAAQMHGETAHHPELRWARCLPAAQMVLRWLRCMAGAAQLLCSSNMTRS